MRHILLKYSCRCFNIASTSEKVQCVCGIKSGYCRDSYTGSSYICDKYASPPQNLVITLGNSQISPSITACNIGVNMDNQLPLSSHIANNAECSFTTSKGFVHFYPECPFRCLFCLLLFQDRLLQCWHSTFATDPECSFMTFFQPLQSILPYCCTPTGVL